MTPDNGAAALAERLHDHSGAHTHSVYSPPMTGIGNWIGTVRTVACTPEYHQGDAAEILGERSVFLPDGLPEHLELAYSFWVHYRCGWVGCETVELHEHGDGQPMRDMTAAERGER